MITRLGLYGGPRTGLLVASLGDTHDSSYVGRVKRVKDRPKPVENTLRPLMEAVIELRIMAEDAKDSIRAAKIDSQKIPRWEQRAKQAQIQVTQLTEVTKDIETAVNNLHVGLISTSQMHAIAGKVERVRDLAVTDPIKTAAKTCQGLCQKMIKGLP